MDTVSVLALHQQCLGLKVDAVGCEPTSFPPTQIYDHFDVQQIKGLWQTQPEQPVLASK
jgi:hypothetical protein